MLCQQVDESECCDVEMEEERKDMDSLEVEEELGSIGVLWRQKAQNETCMGRVQEDRRKRRREWR